MRNVSPLRTLPLLLWAAALAQPPGKPAPKPLFRDPIFDGAADPVLAWDRAGRKWVMFYTNRRASLTDLPGVEWVHGTRIGMAESLDGGATWNYTGTVEVPFGNPDYTHWAPEVIDFEGTYHLYLSIVPGIFRDWNAARQIIHLTSQDLHRWEYRSTLDLGSDRVIDPSVARLPDGSFRMWYKNERARDGSIYYADSTDLDRWASRGVAIPGGRGEGPKIFRWKDSYWMLVDVWDGIAVYRSADCLEWKRQPANLLKEPGTLPTDQSKGDHVDVVASGDRAWMFYFVHQGGKDAEGKPPKWQQRTVIQTVELELSGGQMVCDRNRQTRILLAPPAKL
jgi:hypothetical protein